MPSLKLDLEAVGELALVFFIKSTIVKLIQIFFFV